MLRLTLCFLTFLLLVQCEKDTEGPFDSETYFPPLSGNQWEETSAGELDWNENALPNLYQFLEENDTRAFIVLKDGKIVIEEYWNKSALGLNFGQNSNWYWASAAKTLTSFLIGQASDDGKIDIENPSSTYLGNGWSSLSQQQESNIKVRHHLSMTTGLDDANGDIYCTEAPCLKYLSEPGTRWAYHNGPYTILDRVIEGAVGEDFDEYFDRKLKDKIGMDGFWTYQGYNHLYFSTARSMARFGLLILRDGEWNDEQVLEDKDYLRASINSSQDINPSYGYLWWLNGKTKYMYPRLQIPINGYITPNAPPDMYAAMGKDGQFLNIVPSQNMVIIRMGGSPEDSLILTKFQNDVWEKLNEVTGL